MHGIFYKHINHFNITHTLVSIFMFIRVCDRINPQIDIIGLYFQHVLVFNFTGYIQVGEIDIEFGKTIQFKKNSVDFQYYIMKIHTHIIQSTILFYNSKINCSRFLLDKFFNVSGFDRKLSYLQPVVVTPVLGNTIRQ